MTSSTPPSARPSEALQVKNPPQLPLHLALSTKPTSFYTNSPLHFFFHATLLALFLFHRFFTPFFHTIFHTTTGGYTTSCQPLIDLLRNRARPYLFSNSIPPAVVAAASKVLCGLITQVISPFCLSPTQLTIYLVIS